jgi:hypothetical protein
MPRIKTKQSDAVPKLPKQSTIPIGAGSAENIAMDRLGGSVRQLGGVLGNIAADMQAAKTQAQYSEFKANWDTEHGAFYEGLALDEDYQSFGKKYQKFHQGLKKNLLRDDLTPRARREIENHMTQSGALQANNVSKVAFQKEKDHFRANAKQSATIAAENGLDNVAEMHLDLNKEYFTKEEMLILKDQMKRISANAQKAAAEQQEQALMNSAKQSAMAMGDKATAMMWIDATNFSNSAKVQLRGEVGRRFDYAEEKRKEAEEVAMEEDRDEIEKSMREGTATPEQIDDSSLDEKEQLQYQDRLLSGRTPKTDIDAWDTLDTAVTAYTNDPSPEGKKKVMEQLVEARKAEKLSDTDYRSLKHRVTETDNEGSPINRPAVKRGHAAITMLRNLDAWMPEDIEPLEGKRQNHLTANRLSDELDRWIEKNPDATDEQVQNKVRSLTEPAMVKVTLPWWQKLLLEKERPSLGPRALTEERVLTKRKIAVLEEKGYWAELSEAEQETIRRAFMQGKTVADVVEIITNGTD